MQSMNEACPIEVTPLEIVKFVKLQQSENAHHPIELTLLGMVMLVKL